MLTPSHTWHWQPFGTPWKGPAIYHVTLSVADHRPLLGKLVIPSVSADSSSSQNPVSSSFQRPFQGLAPSDLAPLSSAYIERSDLGKAVVRCMARMTEVFPQIRLLKYTVMESHVHFIIHVTEPLPVGIQEVLRRFWRSCEKEAHLLSSSPAPLPPRPDFVTLPEAVPRPRSSHSACISELSPLTKFFLDRPYIRPLSRKGQLPLSRKASPSVALFSFFFPFSQILLNFIEKHSFSPHFLANFKIFSYLCALKGAKAFCNDYELSCQQNYEAFQYNRSLLAGSTLHGRCCRASGGYSSDD